MNKLKKGLVTGLLVSAVALTAVFSGKFKNAKADNIKSTSGTEYERNTNLSVDSNGVLQVKRNELGNDPMGKEGTWTVFVYMCGSDLESNYHAASTDIKEMISASESDKVNIVIQTDGSVMEETIESFFVPFEKAMRWCKEGVIKNAGTEIGLNRLYFSILNKKKNSRIDGCFR